MRFEDRPKVAVKETTICLRQDDVLSLLFEDEQSDGVSDEENIRDRILLRARRQLLADLREKVFALPVVKLPEAGRTVYVSPMA